MSPKPNVPERMRENKSPVRVGEPAPAQLQVEQVQHEK